MMQTAKAVGNFCYNWLLLKPLNTDCVNEK